MMCNTAGDLADGSENDQKDTHMHDGSSSNNWGGALQKTSGIVSPLRTPLSLEMKSFFY